MKEEYNYRKTEKKFRQKERHTFRSKGLVGKR